MRRPLFLLEPFASRMRLWRPFGAASGTGRQSGEAREALARRGKLKTL
jgi:hypothetical protein